MPETEKNLPVTAAVRDINALIPAAQTACRRFLSACRAAEIPVFLTETYRSRERQEYLYSLGRTVPGKIVTWTKNSRHTSGRAWDIACRPPQPLYDAAVLEQAGRVAERLGLIWGGRWQVPDRPHIEMPEDWREGPVTTEQAKQLLRSRLNFDENTMLYLEMYRYGEELIRRIAEALQE